jgi:hypothetical protein
MGDAAGASAEETPRALERELLKRKSKGKFNRDIKKQCRIDVRHSFLVRRISSSKK